MPQLDFNLLFSNFLLVSTFFIFFYLFLNLFFLRRVFSIILYRNYLSCVLTQKQEYYFFARKAVISLYNSSLEELIRKQQTFNV